MRSLGIIITHFNKANLDSLASLFIPKLDGFCSINNEECNDNKNKITIHRASMDMLGGSIKFVRERNKQIATSGLLAGWQ